MPETEATAAIGTQFQLGDATLPAENESFVTIAEVLDIDGPNESAEELDATNHSTVGNRTESIPGLLDGGQASFPLNMIPSHPTQDHITGLYYLYKTRARRNYRIVHTDEDNTTLQFRAFIMEFGRSMPVRDINRYNVTLRVTGEPFYVDYGS